MTSDLSKRADGAGGLRYKPFPDGKRFVNPNYMLKPPGGLQMPGSPPVSRASGGVMCNP